jgi:transcriptional regulator with XRE-family HTH domain
MSNVTKDKRDTQLAERIRAARVQAGLSQGQLARVLGLHRPAISEIEAARRNVKAAELTGIAEALRVSTNWLLGNESHGGQTSPKVELAARELAKLKPGDLERVLALLRSLGDQEE